MTAIDAAMLCCGGNEKTKREMVGDVNLEYCKCISDDSSVLQYPVLCENENTIYTHIVYVCYVESLPPLIYINTIKYVMCKCYMQMLYAKMLCSSTLYSEHH